MVIFLFIVTAYSSANLYTFYRLSSLLNHSSTAIVFFGVLCTVLILAPVIIPVYSNRGSEQSVKVVSLTGYLWLAFLVPFFPACLVIDAYTLIASFMTGSSPANAGPSALSPITALLLPAALSLAVNVYGLYEANNLCIERLRMPTKKLPPGRDRVRIAQISDLHLGILVRDRLVRKVINAVNSEQPDIIVSTGDLVDGITRHVAHLPEILQRLNAPLGKLAIVGNHEMYGGIKKTSLFIKESGFTLLRGEGLTIDNTINVAGMDFVGGEAGTYKIDSPQKNEQEILAGLPVSLFTLLLKHRPDVETQSLGLFDLQLSGHSHKGQIFPMSLATMFIFSYHTGFTRLQKGSAIYTSRGTGTAGPPVRFLSRPEITIIDVVRQ